MTLEPQTPLYASERISYLQDLAAEDAVITAELIRELIKETNALRRSGDPEYVAYLRFCAGTTDGNLVTMY